MAIEADVLETEALTGEESVAEEPTEAPEVSVATDVGEEPAEEAPKTDTDGQPRDEHGRFAPKAVEAQADGDTAPAPVIDPLAPAEPEGQDFAVNVDKRSVPIPGAKYYPGEGLYVSEPDLPRTQQLLSQGLYLEQNWKRQEAEWQTRIAEAESKAAPKDLVDRENRANALLAELTAVLSDEEKLVEFVQNLQTNGPALMERARARQLEEQLQKYQNAEKQVTTQAQTEQEQSDKVQAFDETLSAMKADARFKVFSDEDWQEFIQEMADLETVLFVRKDDGLYLDQGRMVKAAERQAKLLNRSKDIALKQVQGVKKAVEFNAQRAAPAKAPPPAAAPPEPTDRPARETKEEWQKRNGIYF